MARGRPAPAVEALRRRGWLSTGCAALDEGALGGLGLPTGAVTELCGEATAGKTQLCLQLLLCAQLPVAEGGLGAAAAYVSTEGRSALQRLREIAQSRAALAALPGDPNDKVYVEEALGGAEQLEGVLERCEALLAAPLVPPVRLLVVDSVAAAFRDGEEPAARRADRLYRVARMLKEYAHRFGAVVVVTNHVVDVVDEAPRAPHAAPADALATSGRRVRAALGLHWSSCVNARLFLTREPAAGGEPRRTLRVAFAPHLPPAACHFVVRKDGVWAAHAAPRDDDGQAARADLLALPPPPPEQQQQQRSQRHDPEVW